MARSHQLMLLALVAGALTWWALRLRPEHEAGGAAAAVTERLHGPAAASPRSARATRLGADVPSMQAAVGEVGEPLGALDCDAPAGDVARVDGQAITAAELCAAWRRLSGSVRQGDPVVMDRQSKQWLERKIDGLLVARALAADGLEVPETAVDAAVQAAVERQARPVATGKPAPGDALVEARKAFEAQLKATGSTLEQVREDLRERLALETLVDHREPFEATDAALRRAYAVDPTRFGVPRTAVVEGFLARAPESATASVRQQALDLATAFATRVADGESPEAAVVPELQHMPRFEVTSEGAEPQLAAAAFALAPDAWSPPVHTRAGFAVLRLIEVRDGEARPFSEVRELVRQRLQGEHAIAARQRILAALRSAATIEYLQW